MQSCRTLTVAFATCGLVHLQSCTYSGAFDARHFANLPIAADAKLGDRAVIVTTPALERETFSGRPETFVGSAVTISLPVIQQGMLKAAEDLRATLVRMESAARDARGGGSAAW